MRCNDKIVLEKDGIFFKLCTAVFTTNFGHETFIQSLEKSHGSKNVGDRKHLISVRVQEDFQRIRTVLINCIETDAFAYHVKLRDADSDAWALTLSCLSWVCPS